MAYLPNIPAAADQISVSQGQIQGNFQAINTGFNQNHVGLNAALGTAGQHTFVQLQPQAPTPAFAGIPGLWTSNVANDLMLHAIHPAVKDVNLTNYTFTAADGYCYLPCGLLMKFGRGQTGNVLPNIGFIQFNFPGPAFTQVPFVMACAEQGQPGNLYRISIIRTPTAAQMTLNTRDFAGNNVQANFQWFAIGI